MDMQSFSTAAIIDFTQVVRRYSNSSSSNSTSSGSSVSAIQNITVTGTVMKCMFIAVGIVGIVTNVFVISVIVKTRQLRQQPRNWLIGHKSAADILGSVLIIVSTFKDSRMKLEGSRGFLICSLWLSNVPINIPPIASEYTLVALTVEVYMAIVHPVRHKSVFTRRLITVIIIMIWPIAAAWPVAVNVITADVIGGVCYAFFYWPAISKPGAFANLAVKMGIPMAFYVTCYIKIIASLRAKGKVNPTVKMNTFARHNLHQYAKVRSNVAMVFLFTLMLHIVMFLGNQIDLLMSAFGRPLDRSALEYQVFLLAIYVPGSINVIIYVIRYDRFRKAVQVMFRSNTVRCTSSMSCSNKMHKNQPADQANDMNSIDSPGPYQAPSASSQILQFTVIPRDAYTS